jgi:hypothetical protein
MRPALGSHRSGQLCDAIWDLEGVRDIRELRLLFSKGATQ